MPQIACPIPASDGRFSLSLNNYVLILFRYIEGQVVGFGKITPDILVKLSGLVGRLHNSTPSVDLANPLIEDFRISFEYALPEALDELVGQPPDDRPSWLEFQALLGPRREEILGHLQRLKELQGIVLAKTTGRDMVTCHTDLHGGNLMVDQTGSLYILDWEGAMLAPPEHDLSSSLERTVFGISSGPTTRVSFPGLDSTWIP